ncbi:Tm-1-like ATP-binding domain-containing protein [Roseibacillus ishigakijimensis]|uniref:Tm-1-like ATP-binding domain-containing protein n=1 Tax=Roseibacillus ishigakijimensis TaxID=454146 RepID=A0A934RKZ7_9BACT|nr:Tm-1-like ATP-binding domain-containing protein [Roseibacillus ishigakijimensis]MBK1833339.1 Tm-1-like ATP-binding domain-containing protein [Roseibacillus ishigakijimensis]
MATIAVVGTLDSKGKEHAFVAEEIRRSGQTPLLIDVGTLGEPQVRPDRTREEVLQGAAAALPKAEDRGERVTAMAQALPIYLQALVEKGEIDGVISLGGGGGTAIATAGMRALPIGFPKLMVSTLASGNTAPYVGTTDIVMFPSIVDVAGLNQISRRLFSRAAGAICGMAEKRVTEADGGENDKPLIVASMFGNSTDCVDAARAFLEEEGYEVLVFHSTGTGGRTMESLIESGMVAGVLDVTTTEWADELVGGILSAGPHRLEAAGKAGLPAIVVPGCLDMVNFGGRDSVPAQFEGRTFYQHNPQVTLMRTSPAESRELGRILAEKVNAYTGPVSVLLPLGGLSLIGVAGQPFHDPEADAALFASLREHLGPQVELCEVEAPLNDPEFASACARALLRHLTSRRKESLSDGAEEGPALA